MSEPWIPVETRMPEPYCACLISYEGERNETCCGWLDPQEGVWRIVAPMVTVVPIAQSHERPRVTHFRDLPVNAYGKVVLC
jgi:hypothetical protein